jgi:hypothetical protein
VRRRDEPTATPALKRKPLASEAAAAMIHAVAAELEAAGGFARVAGAAGPAGP